jgi:hypothetical protein
LIRLKSITPIITKRSRFTIPSSVNLIEGIDILSAYSTGVSQGRITNRGLRIKTRERISLSPGSSLEAYHSNYGWAGNVAGVTGPQSTAKAMKLSPAMSCYRAMREHTDNHERGMLAYL